MRVIQYYDFLIGTKIPFSDWPKIVNTFLSQERLSYGHFQYYFDDSYFDPTKPGEQTACHKAIKRFPSLGTIFERETDHRHKNFFLTSFGAPSPCTEAEFLPMLPTLYRKCGFNNSYIFYQDIDFFSRKIFSEVDLSDYTPILNGSAITLQRWSVETRWNGITLSIDITNDDELLDATPYRNAMAALLPGIKCMEYQKYFMPSDVQAVYNKLNIDARPLVVQSKEFFAQHLPVETKQICSDTALSLAPLLKQLCKLYGYTYMKHHYGLFLLQKRTPNGHYITLEIDAGKYRQEANACITYQGLGFSHHIWSSSFNTRSKSELDESFQKLFETLRAAEGTVLPALDAHFPPTPEWFVPNLL